MTLRSCTDPTDTYRTHSTLCHQPSVRSDHSGSQCSLHCAPPLRRSPPDTECRLLQDRSRRLSNQPCSLCKLRLLQEHIGQPNRLRMDRSDQLLLQIQTYTCCKVLMCRHRHLCFLEHTECTKSQCLLRCTRQDCIVRTASHRRSLRRDNQQRMSVHRCSYSRMVWQDLDRRRTGWCRCTTRTLTIQLQRKYV